MDADADAEQLLLLSLRTARMYSTSMAVLRSWCGSLDTRRVVIVWRSLAELRLVTSLLTEAQPFPWPEHDLFSLFTSLMHARLDGSQLVRGADRVFDGARQEVSFEVRLPGGVTKLVIQPLAYSAAADQEGQVCHNVGCRRAQPEFTLHVCAGCHGAKYCSKACQTADWNHVREGCWGHRVHRKRLQPGGAWHPSHPGSIPAAIADRFPGVFQ